MSRHMSKDGVEFVRVRMLQSARAAEQRELEAMSPKELKKRDKELTAQMERMEAELKVMWERVAAVRELRSKKKTKGAPGRRLYLGTLEHMIEVGQP